MMTSRRFMPLRLLLVLLFSFASLSFTIHAQESGLTGRQSRAPFVDCDSAVGMDIGDCKALVKLYKKTRGEKWADATDWLETDTPCTWFGVTCNGNRVNTLTLVKNKLVGTLPGKLKKLTSITVIDIQANEGLVGKIPPEIGNLVNLQYLDLKSNQLTGSIPPEIGNLTNLTTLNLSSNNWLTGSIPPEIGNLTNLTVLDLRFNRFTGSIPPEIGNLTNLTTLNLRSNNQLTGSIPPEIGNLTNLTTLELSANRFTGSIPPEIGNLTNLTRLFLADNRFTGSIPPEIGNLANLMWLDLRFNRFTGSIPPELGNLTNLTRLELWANQLTGSIPPELGNLTNLTRLELWGNQFTGSIPPEIGNLTNLIVLDLRFNRFTESIPPEIGNLTNLAYLLLGDNQLTGSIPPELGNLTNMARLSLEVNQLDGDFPVELTGMNPYEEFSIRYNKITASDPLVIAYLDSYDSGWKATQTTSPTDLAANFNANNFAVKLTWTPIEYQADPGYYTLGCGINADGSDPIYVQQTANKSAGSLLFIGLPVGTYYCTISTTTLSTPYNQIPTTSATSAPVFVEVTTVDAPVSGDLVDTEPYQLYLNNFDEAIPERSVAFDPPIDCAPEAPANLDSVYYDIPVIDETRGGPVYFPRGFAIIRTGGPVYFPRRADEINADTILAIYEINPDDSLTLLDCNDDANTSTDGTSAVSFKRKEDQAYRVVIWNKNGSPEMLLQAVSQQNLLNAGFEIDVDHDLQPDDWTINDPGAAQLNCDSELAHTGSCALEITGNGAKVTAKQTFKIKADAFAAGDTPQMTAHVERTNILEGGKIVLKVKYVNGSTAKTVFPLLPGSSTDYELVFTAKTFNLAGPIIEATVQFVYSGASGSLRVDDVTFGKYIPQPESLGIFSAASDKLATDLIPLPSAQ